MTVSSIARVEVLSALARKLQMQEATVEGIGRVKDAFLSNCERIGMVEVSDDVIREAQDLVSRIRIKTLDAIHLASII
jgi:predicted nucleic acid-binding protein